VRGTCAAVIYIDVDNFKQINDGLSHQAGDRVLAEVGRRLRGALRPSDMVGRLGGDEFVAVLDDLDRVEDVVPVAEALRQAIAEAVVIDGVRLLPTVSIGIAAGRGRVDAMALLREADDALRQAKSHGRNRCEVYTPGMSQSALNRLGIESQLRDALQERRVEAHFQPVVDLTTGRLAGYEALARIRQVSGGVAPNAEFIGVAEQSGLIVPLGREVVVQAIEAASMIGADLRMAVNASGQQLNDPAFADDVIGALYQHQVDARRLIIEVTETTILHLAHWAHTAITRLTALGVGLHVDDFGTGYSSVTHLHDMPVTGMKLDRSFTRELTSRSSASYRLAEGLAALANSLRLTTIAEGVETPLQRELLQEAGWQCGQGWLFGRAEPTPF
jgi:diguanylate cyclase (GGDEF)-like protein